MFTVLSISYLSNHGTLFLAFITYYFTSVPFMPGNGGSVERQYGLLGDDVMYRGTRHNASILLNVIGERHGIAF